MKLYMLCGVSYSGKSTYVRKLSNTLLEEFTILDVDSYIERQALLKNKTYTEVFKESIGLANLELNMSLKKAIASHHTIIWDQTNLTVSTRMKKLNLVPDWYTKIAVYFPIPSQKELLKRRTERPNKEISFELIQEQILRYEIPTFIEGFNKVINAAS